MKKKINASKIAKVLLAFIPIIITAIFYSKLPEKIPMHWGLDGTIDRYGSKVSIWGIAVMPIIFLGLFKFLPKIDPRKSNYDRFKKYYDGFGVVMFLFLILMQSVTISESINPGRLSVGRIVVCAIGLLFMYVGNIMPKMKSNFFMGIKNPWTLSDTDVWNKTHRMSGVLWFFGGAMIAICPFVFSGKPLVIVVTLIISVIVIVPSIMSFVWYKSKYR